MKRHPIRMSDIKATLVALKQLGMTPSALDTMPDGTHRWHFTPPADNDENALDRELAAFEARHGHG